MCACNVPIVTQDDAVWKAPIFVSGFRFYGAGGGGYYTVQGWKTIDFELRGFDTDNDHIGMFGWWILGGVEYCLGHKRDLSAIFMEVKYTEASETECFRVFDESSHAERSGKMDVDLSGMSICLGFRGEFYPARIRRFFDFIRSAQQRRSDNPTFMIVFSHLAPWERWPSVEIRGFQNQPRTFTDVARLCSPGLGCNAEPSRPCLRSNRLSHPANSQPSTERPKALHRGAVAPAPHSGV